MSEPRGSYVLDAARLRDIELEASVLPQQPVVLELVARIRVLEGHRDQWRRIAFRLYEAGLKVVRQQWTLREKVPANETAWNELVSALSVLEDDSPGRELKRG